MPDEKNSNKLRSVKDLRHAEYYDMQSTFDDLYEKSEKGENFDSLMDIILSRENILLAYRNIKANTGSNTRGTDRLTIKNIGKLNPDEMVEKVRYIIQGSKHGYRPKPIRRKNIPKPNGKLRPLGIPCIWDRLVQQCIKQVMEPICEAKFSNNSYGFRPSRSVEHAIAETHRIIQKSHMHYVIEFDIKSFFDEVDHSKLIKQMWALGIRDKQLLYVIKQILKAPIRLEDNCIVHPKKGTPQGGIISPLLANIVLNELDHWVDGQWLKYPGMDHIKTTVNQWGTEIKSNRYSAMRSTKMKEMYIVRYADDFRIFCKNREQAELTKIAVTKWLKERLRLDISEEKTKIVNVRKRYTEFLGFKLKVIKRANKHVISSHVKDEQLAKMKKELAEQLRKVAKPRDRRDETEKLRIYNSMVLGMQNYFCIATNVCSDFRQLQWATFTVIKSQFKAAKKNRSKVKKEGQPLTKFEKARFGKSKQLLYSRQGRYPIYPIGYIKPKPPISKKKSVCIYTPEGREEIHNDLKVNVELMLALMRQPIRERTSEYSDNRISLFSAQRGKCAVTGRVFKTTDEIHCHHKKQRKDGGNDKYENLVLVFEEVHKLIHATKEATIKSLVDTLGLTDAHLTNVNRYRTYIGLQPI